ncbi:hypothetical protein GGTG_09398 [Gaeumannomyces tritici R3-111a-1]|uniref:Uncharacterized protein n=1 Tax=Gaeumannomyces tritici (strain R3-111a-1) TaxID=644352 RepID=J3P7A2_GAET3|nr:hypothetical protein GGTG_09398 [Gaeumannomyces tritici R3-111a-1]EJT72533.1 hypothetical protein GGTG_09398 [Gaeumannomyces tritici R3-111a-1]
MANRLFDPRRVAGCAGADRATLSGGSLAALLLAPKAYPPWGSVFQQRRPQGFPSLMGVGRNSRERLAEEWMARCPAVPVHLDRLGLLQLDECIEPGMH